MFKTLSLEARLFALFFVVLVVIEFTVVLVVVLLVVNDLLFVCKFQVTAKLLFEGELLTAWTEICCWIC